MSKSLRNLLLSMAISAIAACAGTAYTAKPAQSPLAGTRWQLLEIAYSDDTTRKPSAPGVYRMQFDDAGRVAIQADCNRMNGTYLYSPPSGLEFGPLAVTRALCPPGSLFDAFNRDMPAVRSFVIKDGTLHLALMADGGIYRFQPQPEPGEP